MKGPLFRGAFFNAVNLRLNCDYIANRFLLWLIFLTKITIFKYHFRVNTMRQLLSCLTFISITALVTAQAQPQEVKLGKEATHSPQNESSVSLNYRGSDFFCEDFSNGFEGNNPYGAWTFEDSGENTIWMMATDQSPEGEWSTEAEPLASPSADNGWVIFDADRYNTLLSPNYEDVSGYLYSPTMDMSALGSVIVDYYHVFHYCCLPEAPIKLEVTVDGGNDWVSFPAHGTFIQSTNETSLNPHHTIVDISCIASNQSSVQIRFAYNSNSISGYTHYYWGLDDVCIYENEISNDLEVVQVTNGDISSHWEYRSTPLSQQISADEGGMVVGTIFRNNGYSDQTGVVITIEIFDENMDFLSITTSDPFGMSAPGNLEDCATILSDTLYLTTNWTSSSPGTFLVRTSITSDQGDEQIDNNVLEKSFNITDQLYAHDEPTTFDLELSPRLADNEVTTYDPAGYASKFHFPNDYDAAYGIEITPGPSSESDCYFLALLYESVDDGTNLFDANEANIVASSEWTYDAAWNGEDVYLPFDESYLLDSDHLYFAAILEDLGTEHPLTVMANANDNTDNSTLIYHRDIDGTFKWFDRQSSSPAVRLIVDVPINVEELAKTTEIILFQNIPNPALFKTSFAYSLAREMKVSYEIMDTQGRVVDTKDMGTVPSGEHQVELATSDLANGIYTYTLIANNVRLTKQMIVAGK